MLIATNILCDEEGEEVIGTDHTEWARCSSSRKYPSIVI